MLKEVLKDSVDVLDYEEVKYKDCGNVKEIVYMAKRNKRNCLLKVDKDNYIDMRTGELREYEHAENRGCNIASVKKSLSDLRDLLNTNITEVQNCRWVTITYRQRENTEDEAIPMTDPNKLHIDNKNFMKRLKRRYPGFEYIEAVEPQGTGSLHCHIVFIWNHKAPYIPNEEMAELWGQGYTTTKRLDDVDNVGAYLTAYLGDMELSEAIETGSLTTDRLDIKEVEYMDEGGQKQSKKYIKGARLHLYPPGFNLYRSSRGIKKPDIVYMTHQEAKKKVSDATLTFKTAVQITDPESGYQNTIQHEYYNTKPKKGNIGLK